MTAGSDIKPKWGDQEDLEDYEDYEDEFNNLMEKTSIEDNSINKTIIEYRINEKGQKIKIIKKCRVFKNKKKINKKIEERKKWRKFGDCASAPPGPEKGITSLGEETFLNLSSKSDSYLFNEEMEPNFETKTQKDLAIICRNCGGYHWSLQCPELKDKTLADKEEIRPSTSSGRYIPPNARGKSIESDYGNRRDDTATIRVTNLSEDTKESDLKDLFSPFGLISRIYLAKNKDTGLSKGFAFINYKRKEDAARAIEKLSGYGYDHLILHVEWAK
jgi:translation initiation factor 3 subunit G